MIFLQVASAENHDDEKVLTQMVTSEGYLLFTTEGTSDGIMRSPYLQHLLRLLSDCTHFLQKISCPIRWSQLSTLVNINLLRCSSRQCQVVWFPASFGNYLAREITLYGVLESSTISTSLLLPQISGEYQPLGNIVMHTSLVLSHRQYFAGKSLALVISKT